MAAKPGGLWDPTALLVESMVGVSRYHWGQQAGQIKGAVLSELNAATSANHNIRPSQVHVRDGGYTGIGVAPGLPLPVMLGGGYQQGPGSTRNFATIGPLNVLTEAAVPDVPAYEYTVLLDKKTNPPDPYLDATQRPAIIIVQNRYATDIPLAINDRAFVRVVGNVAHIMRADTIPPAVERLVSAGPLPIPLPLPTGSPPCDVIAEVSGECR